MSWKSTVGTSSKTSIHLTSGSKLHIEIYEVSKRQEKEIINLELTMQPDRSHTTRTTLKKTKIEFVSYLIIQKNILRQKAKVKWLVNGDTNSTLSHKFIQDI